MDAGLEVASALTDIESCDHATDPVPLTAAERSRFEQLYRAQKDAVTRMLRARLPNEDDAQEVMQEAFLRLLRYRHFGPDSLKYLLFRVALNLAVTLLRQAGVRQQVSLDDDELVSEALPIDQLLLHEEKITQVALAIQALPPRCRQMYVMNRLRGVRQREIAQHCGISTRMVEMNIAKAQALVRARVGVLVV